ncbi:TetR/AcrR family transcriptional regulator [Rhizobium sp. C4]|uniref:TetR/AcrR family transcriptional regulator n=1 Tax=Rhizobium sp. C4 TaxID=1349800 RepID=UPI001E5B071F|nr:TetR/AcrR family transcriptional regulator [Rhizobium sp. C4]MCD2174854.1 TetR/AcrR family transcriptional regulator [Rhizobium sp. C4]
MTTIEDAEKGPRKQADRVRDMQDRLIAATVVCLDRYGYSGTSISAIQDAAGVSRGAILHHYPSRQDLIAATASRLLDAALRPTREGRPGRGDGAKSLEELLLFYWRQVMNVPEGRAFIEIVVACRTDEALESALADLFTTWDAKVAESARLRFAAFTGDADDAALLWSIARTFLRGLIIHARFVEDPAHLENMVRRFGAMLSAQLSLKTAAH